MKRALVACVLCAGTAARADSPRGPQLQIDAGTGVLGVGLEAPLSPRVGWQIEAVGLTTFYLTFVGGGTNTLGYGAGSRITWHSKADGTGLYLAGALRFVLASGVRDDAPGRGLLVSPALTIGQAFRATKTIDVRFGFGALWIHYDMRTKNGPLTADTPFIMVELIVGKR